MTIALYTVWALLPLFFFLMSLYGYLERASGKGKFERPGDFFRQGIFVLLCIGVAVLIDQFLLPKLEGGLLVDYVPIGVWRVLLLPFLLVAAAKFFGPSDPLRISKAPRPSERRKR